jgi:hypothetical protein
VSELPEKNNDTLAVSAPSSAKVALAEMVPTRDHNNKRLQRDKTLRKSSGSVVTNESPTILLLTAMV